MIYNNLQEVYDTAVAGLASQKFQVAMTGGNCAYRAPDGCKCAIGHCIPDEMYCLEMENNSAAVLVYKDTNSIPIHMKEKVRELFSLVTLGQLQDLQRCHDSLGAASYENKDAPRIMMKDNLIRFAHQYGLKIHPSLES
jgi:hypothetical protein